MTKKMIWLIHFKQFFPSCIVAATDMVLMLFLVSDSAAGGKFYYLITPAEIDIVNHFH
jgi:hypothetical protein